MNENLRLSNLQINFQEICRTCLIDKDDLRDIFCFVPLLKECASIQIDLEDDLPKLICLDCMNKLKYVIEFRRQCEVSEKLLLQLKEEIHETFESNFSSLKVKENENTNEVDGSSLDSDFLHDDKLINYCENNILKTFDVITILKTKLTIVSDFSETTINENDNVLVVSELQDLKLTAKYNIVKNEISDDKNFGSKLLSEKFITENKNTDYENDKVLSQSDNESKDLRENNHNKKTNIQRKLKVKKKRKLKVKIDTLKSGLVCIDCNKSFELEVDLEIHKLQHKKFNDLICPKCSKTFGNEPNLKRHLNIHMVNKPYKCKFCDKTFAEPGLRNRHIRIHTGEKPYICDVCGKRFSASSGLSQHMRHHSGKKRFVCTVCSKSFLFPHALRIHMHVHTGEKPYECTVCGRKFSVSFELKIHARIHTGERPFSCTRCDKNFRLNKQLELHMRTHTGYKPHICKICGIGFARPESLITHNKDHTGERPFCCDICKKTFKSNHNLKNHKRRHNNGKSIVKHQILSILSNL